jgi:uncharacterized membrane protein YbjE (DUF340 family)
MNLDQLTKHAIKHTLHCLLGCSIGEVLGMAMGEALSLPNGIQTILAILLAFFFGYLLTSWSLMRGGATKKEALNGAFATDTVSITSMEIVDNAFIWLIPGAIHAGLNDGLFWWSLAAALLVAFIITVPVNRYMIARSGGHIHHH